MTVSASPPKGTPRAEAMMAWLRRTDAFRELIPADAALGWPAVEPRGDDVLLTMPVFAQQRAPGGGVELFPPFATLTVAWDPPRISGYLDLRTADGWTADLERPAGTFPHAALGDSERAYLALRRELFERYDELCRALAAHREPSSAAADELSRLLRILLEPGLEPYYRRLAPAFFDRHLAPANAASPAPSPVAGAALSERLTTLTREAHWLVELSGSEAAAAELAAIERRRIGARAVVAFAGSLKSGRSTLVNVLLDEPRLPIQAGTSTAGVLRVVPDHDERLDTGGHTVTGQALAGALAALQSPDGGASRAGDAVLRIDNEWLREANAELVDTAGLDTPGAALAESSALAADVVVMPVAALNPLDMVERAFLDVAHAHAVPVLVVVTQLDRVDEGERPAVVDVITERARSHESVASVLVPAGFAGRPATSELRDALGASLSRDRRRAQRQRQAALALAMLCDDLIALGDERAAAAQMDADERRRRAQAARARLNASRREWDRLAAQLEQRRSGFAHNAQVWLDRQRAEVEGRLTWELARAPDPRAWWERDLPYRLQAELAATMRAVETSLAEAVDADQRWLAARVTELFESDPKFDPVQPGRRCRRGPRRRAGARSAQSRARPADDPPRYRRRPGAGCRDDHRPSGRDPRRRADGGER
jgi:hypothetical protein